MSDLIFSELTPDEKKIVLDALGFGIDENGNVMGHVDKIPVKDPITNEPIKFENANILPGSTIILDNNPVSLAFYFARYYEKITKG